MISPNPNLRIKSSTLFTTIMEPSLNGKWENNNPKRWLLMVNITATAGTNVDIKVPGLPSWGRSEIYNPFTGRIPFLFFPSPLQMHIQMNKRRRETERLAGVLVTMAASKWNAKACETDSNSRNQVDVIELPVLLIALLHARFNSPPLPHISTS